MPTISTIAAGSSASVSLAAGSSLSAYGMGTMQIAPPRPVWMDGQLRTLRPDESRIGPFSVAVTVNLAAKSGGTGVSYYTLAPTDAVVPGANAGVGAALSASQVASTQSLVSGAWKNLLSFGFRNEAAVRAIGASSNAGVCFNQTTGASTSLITTTNKQDMEAPFSAVRLVGVNRKGGATCVIGNAGATAGAVVGVTETNATDTSNNLAVPVIGGTAYNAVAGATTTLGWRPVTWGGAATVAIADAAAAQAFSLSDWIPLSSVARNAADIAAGYTRPLLLWRTVHDGSASPWSFNTTAAGSRTPVAANRGRTLVSSSAFSDGVGTLTATMSLTTTVNPDFPVVRFNIPVLSVWCVGDSITQNDGIVADKVSSWGWRGCADASTPETPVVFANFGASSQTGATYWTLSAKAALAAGVPPPSVLVIGPASVNDKPSNTNDVRTQESQLALAQDILATCRTYAIPYVIWFDLLPYNSLDASHDALRISTNTALQTMAASYGVKWLAFSAVVGDTATPQRWISAYNNSADGIHPNESAIDTILAPMLTTALQSIISKITSLSVA